MTDSVERLMRSHNKRALAEMLLGAQTQADYCQQQLRESRLDERHAMTYLEQCRQAVGHEGDFPSLVGRLGRMAQKG